MILVPELQTIVILTPRTGTRALKRAIRERYPESILLYRHMEADGVPQGYDRWRKVGVVREPAARLWSLYNYLKAFGIDFAQEHDRTYTAAMRDSVRCSFDEWLLTNERVFTSPYDSAGMGRFFPAYACRHPLPENRKSQFVYLRPDLGTVIYPFADVERLYADLDVQPGRENASGAPDWPGVCETAAAYIERWFAWDFAAARDLK